MTDVATWTIAELGSAITTASIPTIRPLVTWIFPRFTLSSKGSSEQSSSLKQKGSAYALATIGGGRMGSKSYAEIESGKSGDNESEEYILNEDGRVIRQTVKMEVSSETLPKGQRM